MMLRRSFAKLKIFKPPAPINFENNEFLVYSTPSANTFLKVYAPINIGFVLLNGYFAVDEYCHPIV
jgi:hypothetical protein